MTCIPIITPDGDDPTVHPVSRVLPEPLHDVLADVALDGIGEPETYMAYRKPDGRWVLTGCDHPEIVVTPSCWRSIPRLSVTAEVTA